MSQASNHYDLIGDIHGEAATLIALLTRLGYQKRNGCYRHPARQAVFLGDFIDRGPQQRQVVDTVRPMVEHGAALAIMGNHEFNALAYHNPDPDHSGAWLRPHSRKNALQHQAFLDAYADDPAAMKQTLAWFMTLPLWLDLGALRLVHACWHPPSMAILAPGLTDKQCLTPELLIAASREGRPEYTALETLLKGHELALPAGRAFHDKDGNRRTEVRTRWWLTAPQRWADVAMGHQALREALADLQQPVTDLPGYPTDAPTVVLGHYWLTGEPAALADNVICVDYSVAKPGGKLVAWRWPEGETGNGFVAQPHPDN